MPPVPPLATDSASAVVQAVQAAKPAAPEEAAPTMHSANSGGDDANTVPAVAEFMGIYRAQPEGSSNGVGEPAWAWRCQGAAGAGYTSALAALAALEAFCLAQKSSVAPPAAAPPPQGAPAAADMVARVAAGAGTNRLDDRRGARGMSCADARLVSSADAEALERPRTLRGRAELGPNAIAPATAPLSGTRELTPNASQAPPASRRGWSCADSQLVTSGLVVASASAEGTAAAAAGSNGRAAAVASGLKCCQLIEHEGGCFGCVLMAGHAGPHVLSPGAEAATLAGGYALRRAFSAAAAAQPEPGQRPVQPPPLQQLATRATETQQRGWSCADAQLATSGLVASALAAEEDATTVGNAGGDQDLRCCQLVEHEGGCFGCVLKAGHAGPHCLSGGSDRVTAIGGYSLRRSRLGDTADSEAGSIVAESETSQSVPPARRSADAQLVASGLVAASSLSADAAMDDYRDGDDALPCCQLIEHEGGCFGCILMAGHAGPHVLSSGAPVGSSGGYALRRPKDDGGDTAPVSVATTAPDAARAVPSAEAKAIVESIEPGLWAAVTGLLPPGPESLCRYAEAIVQLQSSTTHGPLVLREHTEPGERRVCLAPGSVRAIAAAVSLPFGGRYGTNTSSAEIFGISQAYVSLWRQKVAQLRFRSGVDRVCRSIASAGSNQAVAEGRRSAAGSSSSSSHGSDGGGEASVVLEAHAVVDVGQAQPARRKRSLDEAQSQQQGEEEEEDDDDVACQSCGLRHSSKNNAMLLCDQPGCSAGYHQRCLSPPLASVPAGEWICPECTTMPPPEQDTCVIIGAHAPDDATAGASTTSRSALISSDEGERQRMTEVIRFAQRRGVKPPPLRHVPLSPDVELASSRLEAMSYEELLRERRAWLQKPLPVPASSGRPWQQDWPTALEPLLSGRPVRKRFGAHGTFCGKVAGCFSTYFQVCYEDGDSEEIDLNALRQILVPHAQMDEALNLLCGAPGCWICWLNAAPGWDAVPPLVPSLLTRTHSCAFPAQARPPLSVNASLGCPGAYEDEMGHGRPKRSRTARDLEAEQSHYLRRTGCHNSLPEGSVACHLHEALRRSGIFAVRSLHKSSLRS